MPEEVPAQTASKLGLLAALSGADKEVRAASEVRARLREWLNTLPVTGRVLVANADPRWLQANPLRDPILRPGHTVVLPQRPRTVTVITGDGKRCTVVHTGGYEARAYLEACRARGVDVAWIAQPDGRIQRFGVAIWNQQEQAEPAVGAWIWAPARTGGWPERFSERFISFLATQGPAPDSAESAAESTSEQGGKRSTTSGGESQPLKLSDALGSVQRDGEAAPAPSPSPAVDLRSDELPSKSRDLQVTSSDWGSVGLLQTPTARMRSAGHLSFHYSRVLPYSRINVFLQPFDWMEAGFRYTDISNIPYGPPELSGTQSYKDKSIDVKFRAWKESAYVPELAVGLRDVAGTGLFSGEYVVASKRTGDFDWSVGLGWGYVGARGNIRNPLSAISSRFDIRGGSSAQGGNFALKSYFRGPTALFGGVQYQTPWDSLIVKAEYDGNDYQHEPASNNQPQRSPFNFGLVYRAARGVDISLGFERGNKAMLGVTLYTQLDRLSQPKLADPPLVPVAVARASREPDWSLTSRDIQSQSDWHVQQIDRSAREVRVVVHDAEAAYWRSKVDRIAAVLHRDAPASIDRFTVTYRLRGAEIAEHVIDRDAWVAEKTQVLPPSEQRESIIARAPQEPVPALTVARNERSPFGHSLGVDYGQTIGGPDAFVLYQLAAIERMALRLREDTLLQGAARLRLVDNYDKFRYTAPSNLPRVRTFLREYLTTSRLTMPYLQMTHVGRLGENQYYSVYGGYLEEMFAGVGGEWLYRPFASRLAVGIDINAVRQRDFGQGFGFRDYSTPTGHATLYWDTGWNDVLATVKAGRYLAKDFGATLEVSRVFKNGVTIGAFATQTNVSAAQFGEGSFDKGIFISVPFDALLLRSTGSFANFTWRPLTRDGGAILARQVWLYPLTSQRSDRTLQFAPAPPPNERLIPEDRHDYWTPEGQGADAYTRITPKAAAAQWERSGSMQEHRLVEALYQQNFRNIGVEYDTSRRLTVKLANDQLRPVSRAVGRAARTALQLAPLDARGIIITFAEQTHPVVKYDFFNLDRLRRYFADEIKASELEQYVKVEWLNPAMRDKDPLARLDDLDPEAGTSLVGTVVPDTFSGARIANDVVGAGRAAAKIDWLQAGGVGVALVLSSTIVDTRADRFAQDHASNRLVTNGVKFGNAIPILGFAAAGVLALDSSDPRRSRTGYAAVEAGAVSFAIATGLKYAVGRARPTSGLGNRNVTWLTSDDRFQSFPSRHTTVAWALATPFALEYDAPWLYGVAALTNLARIGSREHWVSDTVAGSLIGYGLGRLFWQSARDQAKGDPKVMFDGSGISMLWDW